ncbi:peptidoglycan-binding protein [Streptomyces sp. 796.1]|uniref:peptidoglycan-binding protein n=1 Tax=Streptomyces sp. 796.1 TaxID=3163029 RepID=UPI0039C9007B
MMSSLPFPGADKFGPGRSNDHITQLGTWLIARGGRRFYSVGAGPDWGPADSAACAAFQYAQGWSGSDADGIPGPETWRRLATATGEDIPPQSAGPVPISPRSVLFTRTSSSSGRAFAEATIRKALALMGLPVTVAWVSGYLTMALRESSYRPNAINTSDSNAKNPPGYSDASDGHPFQCSRGMWQCIPQTFAAYHQPGTSLSIYDPVASCCASINYVMGRYGVRGDGSNLAVRVQQADPNRGPRGY